MNHMILMTLSAPSAFWVAPVCGVIALVVARLMAGPLFKGATRETGGDSHGSGLRGAQTQRLLLRIRPTFIVLATTTVLLAMCWMFGLQSGAAACIVPIAGLVSHCVVWLGMRMVRGGVHGDRNESTGSDVDDRLMAFRGRLAFALTVVGGHILHVSLWILLFAQFGGIAGVESSGSVGLGEMSRELLAVGLGVSLQPVCMQLRSSTQRAAGTEGLSHATWQQDHERGWDEAVQVAREISAVPPVLIGSLLVAFALATATTLGLPEVGEGVKFKISWVLISLPLAISGVGVLASLLSLQFLRSSRNDSPQELERKLSSADVLASGLVALACVGLPWLILGRDLVAAESGIRWWGLSLALMGGVACSLVIAKVFQSKPSGQREIDSREVDHRIQDAETPVVDRLGEGLGHTIFAVVVVMLTFLLSFLFAGGGENTLVGMYGVALAGVGMSSTAVLRSALRKPAANARQDAGAATLAQSGETVRSDFSRPQYGDLSGGGANSVITLCGAVLTGFCILPVFLGVVQNQLHAQIVSDARTHFAESADVLEPGEALSHYLGNGRFAIFAKTTSGEVFIDGSLLLDHAQFGPESHFEEAVNRGQAFDPLLPGGIDTDMLAKQPIARQYVLRGTTMHGDHSHDYSFTVGSTRTAVLRDLMIYYDINVANPRFTLGVVLGGLLSLLGVGVMMRTAASMVNDVMLGILVCGVPLAAGLLFSIGGVVGLLAGFAAAGLPLGVFVARLTSHGSSIDGTRRTDMGNMLLAASFLFVVFSGGFVALGDVFGHWLGF
jgi:hypothetical protein